MVGDIDVLTGWAAFPSGGQQVGRFVVGEYPVVIPLQSQAAFGPIRAADGADVIALPVV